MTDLGKYTKACSFAYPEPAEEILRTFLDRCNAPGWYRGFSASQIQAGLQLACAIRDDTLQQSTHRVRHCLYAIGLRPVPRSKQILQLLGICHGSDLAFLWFLWELDYKTPGPDYTYNEQILLSCIYNIDVIPTVRELHQLLPPPQLPKRVLEQQRVLKEKRAKAAAIAARAESRKNRPKRPLQKLEPYFQRLVLRKKVNKKLCLMKPYIRAHIDVFKLYSEYGEKLSPPSRLNVNFNAKPGVPAWDVLTSMEHGGDDYQWINKRKKQMALQEIERILEDIPGDPTNVVMNKALCSRHKQIQELENSLEDELKVIAKQRCLEYLAGKQFQSRERRERILSRLEHDVEMYSAAFKKMAIGARKQCLLHVVASDNAGKSHMRRDPGYEHKPTKYERSAGKEAAEMEELQRNKYKRLCLPDTLDHENESEERKESEEYAELCNCSMVSRLSGGCSERPNNTTKCVEPEESAGDAKLCKYSEAPRFSREASNTAACGNLFKKLWHQRESQGGHPALKHNSNTQNSTNLFENRLGHPISKNEGGGDACHFCYRFRAKNHAEPFKDITDKPPCLTELNQLRARVTACSSTTKDLLGDTFEPSQQILNELRARVSACSSTTKDLLSDTFEPSQQILNELRARVSACSSITNDLLGSTLEPTQQTLDELRARLESAQGLKVSAYAQANSAHRHLWSIFENDDAADSCLLLSSPPVPAQHSELRAKVIPCRNLILSTREPSEETLNELRPRVEAAWHMPPCSPRHDSTFQSQCCCCPDRAMHALKELIRPKHHDSEACKSGENFFVRTFEHANIKKTESDSCSLSSYAELYKLTAELNRKAGLIHHKQDEEEPYQPLEEAVTEESMSWAAVLKECSEAKSPEYLDNPECCASNVFFKAPTAHTPLKFQFEEIFADPRKCSTDNLNIKREIVAALDYELSGDRVKEQKPDINDAVRKCVQRTWKELIDKQVEDVNPKAEVNPIRLKYSQKYFDPDDTVLMNAMLKDALGYMCQNPKFALASLPDAHKLPFLRNWIYDRYGRVYDAKTCDQEAWELHKICRDLKRTARRFSSLGPDKHMDAECRKDLVNKSKHIKHRFLSEMDEVLMDQVRVLWFAMTAFFSLGVAPRQLFFAYMPARLMDIIRFGHWKRSHFQAWKNPVYTRRAHKYYTGRTVHLQP